MTKAVALGVPILATATPSHIRAVDQFGLDERFLVHEGERWDDKIDGLRQDFDAVQELIARARGIALELYSMERIGGTWLQQIERALDAKDVAATPSRRQRRIARRMSRWSLSPIAWASHHFGRRPADGFRSAAATS